MVCVLNKLIFCSRKMQIMLEEEKKNKFEKNEQKYL